MNKYRYMNFEKLFTKNENTTHNSVMRNLLLKFKNNVKVWRLDRVHGGHRWHCCLRERLLIEDELEDFD